MEINYKILNVDEIPSPALAVFPEIISFNIDRAIEIAGANILRPHIKTCKTPEVARMMIDKGIGHFKCATIAEAEMLGMAGASDVILASQPVPVTMDRLKKLIEAYPGTKYSTIVDNTFTLDQLDKKFKNINVYVDLNVGMNRTGISPENVYTLIDAILLAENIRLAGIHAYNGKNHDIDLATRTRIAEEGYKIAERVRKYAQNRSGRKMILVIGGSPDFILNSKYNDVQPSPGTFVFWDSGYLRYTEMPFQAAAILVTRVISIIDKNLLCLDLGHKAVGAENPINNRVRFIGVDKAEAAGQSEEHLVVRVPDTSDYKVGDVWYGIPFHICPTVALYNELEVIVNGRRSDRWKVTARNRMINY